MKISGFSMCRNAESLYYPVKESVLSALPLVDEFVVAVGRGKPADRTLELLRSIDSPKLRIIETEWDTETFRKGTVHAQQTDLAKSHCTGDWLLYLQADEVLHEADLGAVREQCRYHLEDERVEGLLFEFLHFWGDYDHIVSAHGWYQREIRMVRNRPDIHSWESAQSFRVIPAFDGCSYRQKKGTRKLGVVPVQARVFHYGWVRPPHIMAEKVRALDHIHSHQQDRYQDQFDYGDMRQMAMYDGPHPAVMQERIGQLNWKEQLRNAKDASISRKPYKHERLKSKLLTHIEKVFFGSREIGGYRNYTLVGKKR